MKQCRICQKTIRPPQKIYCSKQCYKTGNIQQINIVNHTNVVKRRLNTINDEINRYKRIITKLEKKKTNMKSQIDMFQGGNE